MPDLGERTVAVSLVSYMEIKRKVNRLYDLEEENKALRDLVRELMQFMPYEKPEQGELPLWIVDIADRARKAIA